MSIQPPSGLPPLRPRPHLPGDLDDILGGGGGTLEPSTPEPPQPVDPQQVTVAVLGMLAPSTQVRLLGHGKLVKSRFVTSLPDLDAVLDGPTRSWPVRVAIGWPAGGTQVVESHEIAAFAPPSGSAPGAPRWGLELATDSAAPLPGITGPGVPASIFCILWPWASFCQ